MLRNGTYCLNNSGSRWITYVNGKLERITLETKSGLKVERAVLFWEAFGNFASACINYKGKRIKVFPDTLLDD